MNLLQITSVKRSNLYAALLLAACTFQGQTGSASDLNDCISQAVQTADDSTTIGDLRLQCEKQIQANLYSNMDATGKTLDPVEERLHQDDEHVLQPFTLMAHKPNYLLFAAFNSTTYHTEHFKEEFSDPNYSLNDVEAKFQLSIKFPLLVNMLNDTFDIYAGYTNRSFWQVYNDAESSPFRETNHEPEIWVQFHPDWEFFGFTNGENIFGAVHQSNGRDGTLSRSWNRVYAQFSIERGNFIMTVKPWIRVDSSKDDDNPDITDFLGHYELRASYQMGEHVISAMSRNNIESGFSKGAFELSYSFPLGDWPYLKGYMQYFTGYGESLIDYDQYVNSIGIGISITDWL